MSGWQIFWRVIGWLLWVLGVCSSLFGVWIVVAAIRDTSGWGGYFVGIGVIFLVAGTVVLLVGAGVLSWVGEGIKKTRTLRSRDEDAGD